METKNIMIVGVGGQGTLLASKLLGRILLENGYDVKVSEVHGMSQRGGSVVTYVRYGKKVYSPIIDKGEADFVLSFELLEAARWAEYLKEGGVLLTNTQRINPMPVITGAAEYPKVSGSHSRRLSTPSSSLKKRLPNTSCRISASPEGMLVSGSTYMAPSAIQRPSAAARRIFSYREG